MRKSVVTKWMLLAGVALSAGSAQAEQAASEAGRAADDAASSGTTGDIVVTALRRETTLQKTPAAVAAISGEELQARGISDIQDLATAVPSVSFGQTIGQAHIAVRGIGSDVVTAGQDPRVAFYQDGVYIARPGAQLGGMFDVDRVEVLKGPQGTLYGRNATGGAVSVVSRKPTDTLEGYVRAGYGNYNAVTLDGAISGPLAETLTARIAGHFEHRDGYGKNLVTGKDIDDKREVALRGAIAWRPSDRLELLTTVDYFRESDNAFGLHYFNQGNPNVPVLGLKLGGLAARNSRDIYSDVDPKARTRSWGITEEISFDADWAKLRSITSYRKFKGFYLTDIDGTSVQLAYDKLFENAKQFSQEVQLDGEVDRFAWLVGALYFHEKNDGAGSEIPINSVVAGGPFSLRQAFLSIGDLKTESFSAYARVTFDATDWLKLTAGGRYNWEKKSISDVFQFDFSRPYVPGAPIIPIPPFPRSTSDSFSGFTPSATAELRLSPSVFAYFTYSQGFKSGGYNIGVAQAAFRPEKIKSYEAGVKTTTFDGRLKANLIGFHYDYSNLQVSQVRGQSTLVENAAAAKVDGIEAELIAEPVRGFSFGGNLSYLDAKYKDFLSIDPINVAAGPQDLSGNRLTQAPKISYALFAQGKWDVGDYTLTLRGDYNRIGLQYFTPFNNPIVAQDGYGVGSALARVESEAGWSVEAYVRNIGNTKAIAQTYVSSGMFGFPVLGALIPPRTYGLTLGYKL
ncbi:TonB-dependent receptor [Sphingomonas sp. YL-JM2C]